jgi:hypothetical protein
MSKGKRLYFGRKRQRRQVTSADFWTEETEQRQKTFLKIDKTGVFIFARVGLYLLISMIEHKISQDLLISNEDNDTDQSNQRPMVINDHPASSF